ncbi:hypothetical protein TNCV_3173331 [Trichonephila clavipes]|nr:hypothetical protein TNCV_3173331 [Trichonephila clavipes]
MNLIILNHCQRTTTTSQPSTPLSCLPLNANVRTLRDGRFNVHQPLYTADLQCHQNSNLQLDKEGHEFGTPSPNYHTISTGGHRASTDLTDIGPLYSAGLQIASELDPVIIRLRVLDHIHLATAATVKRQVCQPMCYPLPLTEVQYY